MAVTKAMAIEKPTNATLLEARVKRTDLNIVAPPANTRSTVTYLVPPPSP